MATLLSPGINISEVDLTTVIPAAATSVGAFAGPFTWGPANEITLVSNELQLSTKFGKPNSNTAASWFSAANFLSYSNNLKIVRALAPDANNAVANGSGLVVENETDYTENYSDGATTAYGSFTARYPGVLGNTLTVSICPNANAFSQNLSAAFGITLNANVTTSNTSFPVTGDLTANVKVGDLVSLSSGAVSTDYVEVTAITNTSITVASALSANLSTGAFITRRWKYYGSFTDAPGTSTAATNAGGTNDEMHVVVVDTAGKFTGTANAVLERFGFVSKASDALNFDGTSNYYKNVLNTRSQYIWWLTHLSNGTNWGNTAATAFTETHNQNYYVRLANGADGTLTDASRITAYEKFGNLDVDTIDLMFTGDASTTVGEALISIAETRKDCIVFLSPLKSDVVDNTGSELNAILATRNSYTPSSFAVMDSGWKYQYDKYNDVYRWVPLNGDIAGLTARTDQERDPWFSPAGPSRGLIKNSIKLAWNPSKVERDNLYLKGVNPVLTFAGEGTMLYGDKTMLSRPSAFDRMNVRRLFIVLQKLIGRAARGSLFEFNDEFTRAQFVSIVEPFLRDVQGRRGITDYRVVCDETNNTGTIIDRNEFVGDIYIKPARSINFIQLNFVAVRSGVVFDEIVGQF